MATRSDESCIVTVGSLSMTGIFRLSSARGDEVTLDAQLDRVPTPAHTRELLARCLTDEASAAERDEFRALWQGRVRRLLVDHWDDADVWQVSPRCSATPKVPDAPEGWLFGESLKRYLRIC